MAQKDYEVLYRAIADFSALEKAAKKAERRLESLKDQANEVDGDFQSGQAANAKALDKTAKSTDEAEKSTTAWGKALDKAGSAWQAAADAADDGERSTGAWADALDRAGIAADANDRATQRSTASTREQSRTLDLLAEDTFDAAAALDKLVAATDSHEHASRRSTRSSEFLTDALDDNTDAADDNARSSGRAGSALQRLSAFFRSTGRESDDSTRKGNKFGAMLDKLFGKLKKVAGAFQMLAKFGVIGSFLGPIAGALDAIAVSATLLVGALMPLGGLLAGLPAILASVLLPIGALVAGFSGLGDAIGAVAERERVMEDQSGRTGAAAEAAARQQADAVRSLARAREMAARQVQQSERNLRDAQENAIDAQENLNLAREAAVEYLDALEDRLNRQPLLEDRAALNVDIARNELLQTIADPGSTALERRDAEISLAEAEQDLIDLQNEGVEVQEALTEAQADGVDGSDFVIGAQEALADAILGVADAEYALEEARREQVDANRATADSLSDLARAQEAVEESFRDLSPEAQAFATYIASLRPLLIEFKQAVQRNLLPPVQRALARMVDTLFPAFLTGFESIAASMGVVFEDLGERMSDPITVTAFENLFALVAEVTPALGGAVNAFLQAMVELAAAGGPVLRWLSDVATRWTDTFLGFVRDTERVTDIQNRAIEVAQQWGRIISDLWTTLGGVFRGTSEASQTLLDRIEAVTQRWTDWTNSVEGQNSLAEWADRSLPVITEITGLIGDLFRMFARLSADADTVGVFQRIRNDVVPALENLLTVLSGEFTDSFIDLMVAGMDLITTLASNGGALNVFLSTLAAIAESVNFLLNDIPGVSGALTTVLGLMASFAGFAGAIGLVAAPFVRVGRAVGTVWTALRGLPAFFTTTLPRAVGMGVSTTVAGLGRIGIAASGAQLGIAGIVVAAGLAYNAWQEGNEDEYAQNLVRGSEDAAESIRRTADDLVRLSDIADEGFQGEILDGLSFNFDADATAARSQMDGLRRSLQELAADPNIEEIISDPRARADIVAGYQTISSRIAELNVLAEQGGNVGRNAEIQIRQLTDAQEDLAPVMDLVLEDMSAYNAHLREITDTAGQGTTPGMVNFGQSVADAAAEVGLSEGVLRSLIDSGLTPAEVAAGDFEQAELDLATAAQIAADAYHQQANALTALTDPVFRAQEAQKRLTEARAEYQRLQAEGGTEAEIAAALGTVVEASGAARGALLALADTDLSTLNATLNEQVRLNLITEEEKAAFLASISGENGVVPQAAAALGELNNLDPAVLPGVDNSVLLDSIHQTGAAVQEAVGSWWNGQFVRDSWMSGVTEASEDTGDEVLSATNPWLQNITDSFDRTRDDVVTSTEEMGRDVNAEWGDISTTVTRTVDGYTDDVETTHTDMSVGVTSSTQTAIDNMAAIWRRYPGDVARPVNQTIAGPVNMGFVGSFNMVAEATGGTPMRPMPLVPGFNRGGVYEDPRYGTHGPNKDTGLAALTPGEGIVNRNATQANRPIIDAMNNGAVFSMAETEGTTGSQTQGPERFAGVANGVADGRGFNTSGLQRGRTNADQYDLAHARGNNPYAGTANPGYLEGADHDGPGYSSTGFGGVKPWVAKAGHFINEMFSPTSIGGVGSRPNASDHPTGHALDVMVYDDAAKGDAVAEYMAANAGHFAVKYIIWWQHINKGDGWKPMADRGSATANHYDHPHISFLPKPTYESDTAYADVIKGTDQEFSGSGSMGVFREALDNIAEWRGLTQARIDSATSGTWDHMSASMGMQTLDMAESWINAQRGNQYSNWDGSAGVEQWRGVVQQALRIMDQPAGYAGSTLRRMNQESGGNPGIVNNWDSNAKKGTPSVGLMQVIGPTYQRYKHPEHDRGPYKHGTSIDPMSNILSSMRYAVSRYGSLPTAYDRAGGYDSGGFINKGYNLLYSGLNDPEMVTPVPLMQETFAGTLNDFMGGMMSGQGLTAPLHDLSASAMAMRNATVMLTEAVVQQTAVTEQIGTQIGQIVVNNPRQEPTSETLPRTMRRMAYLGG